VEWLYHSRSAEEAGGDAEADASPVVVIKIGGSVFTDLAAYKRCAAYLKKRVDEAPQEQLVVVVSAEFGMTDRLEALARQLCLAPDPGTLDLLWSTGEVQSVATLTLCLHAEGVPAVGLSVHECGLRAPHQDEAVEHVVVEGPSLRSRIAGVPVAVVPGFLARGPGDRVVSLGRGGSDLTAVLLAAGLGAVRCELIKDVPGYFDKDPHRFADAAPLDHITYARALAMARDGCDLVQARAIEAAARHGTPVIVRSLHDGDHQTRLTAAETPARATAQSTAVA
jgi:aspartate kinase